MSEGCVSPSPIDEWPRCYELTLGLEGGRDFSGLLVYSNLPDDPGGPTVAGLALNTSGIVGLDADHDGRLDFDLNHDGKVDVQDMLLLRSQPEQHRDYFRVHYWLGVGADRMPWPWCAAAYDAAVHHGPGPAVLLIQRAVGAKTDSRLGPATLAAVRTAGLARVDHYVSARAVLFRAINDRRRARGQHDYFEAWMNRLGSLTRQVVAG